MLLEIEIRDDRRSEGAGQMGAGGVFEAGKNFLAGGAPADDRAAFQDQDFLPGLGQISRRDQAVVAGANDDRVVFCLGG